MRAAIVCALALTACFVDRPTDKYSCSTTADCTGGRICQSNYCVLATPDASNCPFGCTSCNVATKTCEIDCVGQTCGAINCPTGGWTCNVTCTGDNACGNITCPSQSKCDVTCVGTKACGNVTCRDACKCDVTCTGTACGTLSCPTNDTGDRCTTDGNQGSPCDSSVSGCAKC